MPEPIPIRGSTIRLGQLLKLAGEVAGGGEVKLLLAAEQVTVNGEPEDRRGRQLHPGDLVRVAERELLILSADAGAEQAGEDGPPAEADAPAGGRAT